MQILQASAIVSVKWRRPLEIGAKDAQLQLERALCTNKFSHVVMTSIVFCSKVVKATRFLA